MRIGIMGAGNLGTGLGRHLVARGHELVVGFSLTADKLAEAVMTIAAHAAEGGTVRGASPEDVATHGEVVVLATPWPVTLATLRPLARALAGRVVWDCTNPFAPHMSELTIGTTTSAGEEVAKTVPDARVVKAIPPFAELLHSGSITVDGHAPGLFVCGDDADARATVTALAASIGLAPVDAGPLKLARFTEPLGMLVTNLAYVRGFGPRITSVLLRDA